MIPRLVLAPRVPLISGCSRGSDEFSAVVAENPAVEFQAAVGATPSSERAAGDTGASDSLASVGGPGDAEPSTGGSSEAGPQGAEQREIAAGVSDQVTPQAEPAGIDRRRSPCDSADGLRRHLSAHHLAGDRKIDGAGQAA